MNGSAECEHEEELEAALRLLLRYEWAICQAIRLIRQDRPDDALTVLEMCRED